MFLHSWRVVVPVKHPQIGKSRLSRLTDLTPVYRPSLARAIASDTVSAVVAAVGAESTVLVTDDHELIQAWHPRGVSVVPDPGAGLNPAIEAGWAFARRLDPTTRYAALLGDVPALRPDDLVTALTEAEQVDESFVPDAEGTGTVLRAGLAPVAHFGADSAALHRADGAVAIGESLSSLRRDVDDPESLLKAYRLGLGPATAALLDQQSFG